MPANYAVKITRLNINMSALDAELGKEQAQKKVDEVAQAALNMQQAIAPVLTGKLSKSCEIRKVGRGRHVGSWIEYAIYVELGHETEAGTWVPAQPFIRPSIDAARAVMKKGK